MYGRLVLLYDASKAGACPLERVESVLAKLGLRRDVCLKVREALRTGRNRVPS